jgi:hypothetical protein
MFNGQSPLFAMLAFRCGDIFGCNYSCTKSDQFFKWNLDNAMCFDARPTLFKMQHNRN